MAAPHVPVVVSPLCPRAHTHTLSVSLAVSVYPPRRLTRMTSIPVYYLVLLQTAHPPSAEPAAAHASALVLGSS